MNAPPLRMVQIWNTIHPGVKANERSWNRILIPEKAAKDKPKNISRLSQDWRILRIARKARWGTPRWVMDNNKLIVIRAKENISRLNSCEISPALIPLTVNASRTHVLVVKTPTEI
jgi:hypothetical protein